MRLLLPARIPGRPARLASADDRLCVPHLCLQRDLAITSSSQDPGRSTGSTRASTGRFDPNAPPFLYSPTYLPNQPNQDGTGGQAFAPYVMQAPMGDSYNPYEPGTDGPTSPYSSAATSFGALPQSPVMPLGQMAYSSFDGSNPGYWMMGSPAASAAALPGGPEYNAAGGQRQVSSHRAIQPFRSILC